MLKPPANPTLGKARAHEHPRISGQGTPCEIRRARPAGFAALSVEEAVAASEKLPGPLYVVKAQIHAGGRGKGKFKELGPDAKGGVRLAKTADEVRAAATDMLGNTLVTIQTGDAGKQVNRLYVTDGVDIAKEFYLALLVNRATGRVSPVEAT